MAAERRASASVQPNISATCLSGMPSAFFEAKSNSRCMALAAVVGETEAEVAEGVEEEVGAEGV